mmetsp:Transcript_5368/g.8328  ORF Transcript_5368/g.8328 Transcript_5368/m.8328 type:complete len:353 (+) Transcript_5368:99-1157(+)
MGVCTSSYHRLTTPAPNILHVEVHPKTPAPVNESISLRDAPYSFEDAIDGDQDFFVEAVDITTLQTESHSAPFLTAQQILDGIGVPALVPAFRRPWSCIDGRESEAVISTPGGDAGEFLSGLLAARQLGYFFISSDVGFMKHTLESFLHYSTRLPYRPFYMHTDEHAVTNLSSAMNQSIDLLNVPQNLWSKLLHYVTRPEYVGCGHIKGQLLYPEEYSSDADLVSSFLWAVYYLIFQKDRRILLKVLQGEHHEGSVVIVKQSGEPTDLVPLVRPTRGSSHMFIFNEKAVHQKRMHVAKFFARLVGTDVRTMQSAIEMIAQKQLQGSLSHLANGLPEYEIMLHYCRHSTQKVG